MLIETEHLLVEADSIVAVHFRDKTSPIQIAGDPELAVIVLRNYQCTVLKSEGQVIADRWKEHLKAEEEEMHYSRRRRLSIQNPNPETIN